MYSRLTAIGALCAALATPGCDGGGIEAGFYFAIGDDDLVQLSGLGVDSKTTEALSAKLGFTPRNLDDLGPREDDQARTFLHFAAGRDGGFVNSVATDLVGKHDLSRSHDPGTRPLRVVIESRSSSARVAFEIPDSLDYVRTGLNADDTLEVATVFFEVGSDDPTLFEYTGTVPEFDPFDRYHVEITLEPADDATPEEEELVIPEYGPHSVNRVRGGAASGDVIPMDEISLNVFGASALPLDLPIKATVYVETAEREPYLTIKLKNTTVAGSDAGSDPFVLTGGTMHLVTYDVLELASTDDSAELALYGSDYPSYDESEVDAALRVIPDYRTAMDTSAAAALTQWHGSAAGSRSDAVAALFDVVLRAATSENLACAIATPETIAAGQDPAVGGGLDRDIIRPFHGAVAAAALLAPVPTSTTYRFSDLLVSSYGSVPESTGDTSAACDALILLAEVLETEDIPAVMDSSNNLKQIGIALDAHRAAYLDRLAVEFIEHMDSRMPTDVDIEGEWLTAAKAKADILIESLEEQATTGLSLNAAAGALVQ